MVRQSSKRQTTTQLGARARVVHAGLKAPPTNAPPRVRVTAGAILSAVTRGRNKENDD